MEDVNHGEENAAESDADATSNLAYAAAEAAAAAADEQEQQSQHHEEMQIHTCRICGKADDGRAMVRFDPGEIDIDVARVAPNCTTFTDDITLHVFCGKTAAILPTINQPQYEILSKAGIKNKHGIGSDVNGALARSRCAILQTPGVKDKMYYIVQEVEAVLTALRNALPQQHAAYGHDQMTLLPHPFSYAASPQEQQHHHHAAIAAAPEPTSNTPMHHVKPAPPIRASAGQVQAKTIRSRVVQQHQHQQQEWSYPEPPQQEHNLTSDGKVKCACGGTHLPTGTSKGIQSWRTHVMTKRHQKWMEDNGLLGAV